MGRKKSSPSARRALGVHQRIQERREALGVGIERMSSLLGMDPSNYRRIEAGDIGNDEPRLALIAQLLQTSVAALFGETDHPAVNVPPAA